MQLILSSFLEGIFWGLEVFLSKYSTGYYSKIGDQTLGPVSCKPRNRNSMSKCEHFQGSFRLELDRWYRTELKKMSRTYINGEFFFFFFFFMYDIQHCFIGRPSDSTVSEDAGIEPRTVATTALAVRRSNQAARSHPHKIKYRCHSVWALATIAAVLISTDILRHMDLRGGSWSSV